MKWLALTIASLVGISLCHAQVPWRTSFATAQREAAVSKKPILIDFYADWCGPCKEMERNVFTDRAVRALMGQAVCVRLDVDKRPPEAKRFGVNSIPRIIVLSSDGHKVLMDSAGYQDAPEFASQLAKALGRKAPATSAPAAPATEAEPPALSRVRHALQTRGYAKLKADDPQGAAAGMRLLIGKLGVIEESKLKPIAGEIKKAGPEALPFLLEGMGDKHLAVRAASYKLMKEIASGASKAPKYDPWGPSSTRTSQLAAWKRWMSAGAR